MAAAILAAGESRRLGRPKQLLPYRGEPLLRVIARQVCGSTCASVSVVVRDDAVAIEAALAGLPVRFLANPDAAEGMASSIRVAVAFALQEGHDAVVLVASDQPALTSAHVDALVHAHRLGARFVASRYAGVRGIPALFARDTLGELLALRGPHGARRLLNEASRVAEVDWPEGAFDVDTPDDAARLSAEAERNRA